MTSFKTLKLIGLALLISIPTIAQEFSVGINTEDLNPNAVLKLVSPNGNQGIIIPKLTTAQRNGMVGNLTTEDLGLLVYDSEENKFYYWVDTWVDLSSSDIVTDGSTIIGDGINSVIAIGQVPSENVTVEPFGSVDATNLQEALVQLESDMATNSNASMAPGRYDANENGLIDNAEQVNGFTIESDVPPDAVFTDDQDISTTGEAGVIAITGGSQLKLNVNDEDSDPENENQTVLAGEGISVNNEGQVFEVHNTRPDKEVTLEDGGSGNVVIGGDYPNFTIDVSLAAGDGDSDPENENQTVSAGTGININQVDQDFEVINTAPDQEVSLADGGSGNVIIGGSYPAFTIDVPTTGDADSDPTNENQTVSAGTGISINQVDQDFEVINTQPDQIVTIADAGSGTVTVGGTYPNFTLNVPAGEASLSNLNADISFLPGATRSIFVEDNTGSGDHLGITAGTGLAGVGGDLNLMGGAGSSSGGNINLQAGSGSINGVINLNSEVSVLGNMFRVGSFLTVDGFGQATMYSSTLGNVLDITHNGSGGDAIAINIVGTGKAINVAAGSFAVDKNGNTQTENIDVGGNARIAGSHYVNTRTISGAFGAAAIQPDDYLIIFDATAEVGTIDLPAAPASEIGRKLKIVNMANGTKAMTIRAEGAGVIIANGTNAGTNTYAIRHDGGGPSVFGIEIVQIAPDTWMVTSMSINNPD